MTVHIVSFEMWYEGHNTIGVFKTQVGASRAIKIAIGEDETYIPAGPGVWASNTNQSSYEIEEMELEE